MKKILCVAVCAMLFALWSVAEAQQPKKVPTMGYLSANNPTSEFPRSEVIRLALRELGYIDGQSIAIEYRHGGGKRERSPELAAERVRLKADVTVVGGVYLVIRAARRQ